ncbi:hypothetical protein DXT98_30685 [Agrobacterium sp. ICMP 7243]|nr:hypothetical protein DXT98_30685 [Agrobacterium sp. ICMP 7243]
MIRTGYLSLKKSRQAESVDRTNMTDANRKAECCDRRGEGDVWPPIGEPSSQNITPLTCSVYADVVTV